MFTDKFGTHDLGAPWYAGGLSFLRSNTVRPDAVPSDYIAVVGMPVDWFGWSRAGARWGPRGIREASLFAAGRFGIQTDDEGFVDLRTGRVSVWPDELRLVDTGDVPIFQSDTKAQIEAAYEHIAAASMTSSTTVTLGGDHFVAYPAFEGVIRAWRERSPGIRIGYLHIDSHSDFWNEMTILGRYNHGTCARRISEIPEVAKMAWYGLNHAAVEPSQFEVMRERGFVAATSYYSHRVGAADAMQEILEYLQDGVDALYVSIDIDVVNGSDAPATATPTFDGLSSRDFLEALEVLSREPNLIGLDMCEVHPPVDSSKRTERLASMAILTVLGERVFPTSNTIDQDALRSVFRV